MAEDTANEPTGADKVQKEHEKSVKEDTKQNKEHTKGLKGINLSLKEQKREIEASIALSTERRDAIKALISVDKSLKIAEKDTTTGLAGAVKSVKDNIAATGDNILSGAEGFITNTFGGPLGGIINAVTIGFLKRKIEAGKEEKRQLKIATEKKAEEAILEDDHLNQLADRLKLIPQFAEHDKKSLKVEAKRRLDEDAAEELESQRLAKDEELTNFMLKKDPKKEEEEAKSAA